MRTPTQVCKTTRAETLQPACIEEIPVKTGLVQRQEDYP